MFKNEEDVKLKQQLRDKGLVSRISEWMGREDVFADAVANAGNISRNPVKKAEYLKKVGESVYCFALKEYFAE